MTERNDIARLWSLDGRSAIVTGVSTGSIGEGIARVLAAAGAHVTVSDIRDNGLSAIAKEIGGVAVVADLTDEAAANTLISSPKSDRKSTRLNSSHTDISRMPSSA